MSRRKEDALFSGQVEIEGDSALAQRFGDFMAGLEIDWEEQLSRLTGDPLAHALGSRLRAASRWGQHSLDVLEQDLKEYLQDEGRLLPTRYELDRFLTAVDRLRDDGERLVARVERLHGWVLANAGEVELAEEEQAKDGMVGEGKARSGEAGAGTPRAGEAGSECGERPGRRQGKRPGPRSGAVPRVPLGKGRAEDEPPC